MHLPTGKLFEDIGLISEGERKDTIVITREEYEALMKMEEPKRLEELARLRGEELDKYQKMLNPKLIPFDKSRDLPYRNRKEKREFEREQKKYLNKLNRKKRG